MQGRYIWLLDNGHGGIINGKYQTAGKRSPIWRDRSQIFEGEFNRAIVARIMERCCMEGLRYVNLVPEAVDISLDERVERANAFHHMGECIFVSVHANAGGGTGYEVFTSRGTTRSDRIADIFLQKFAEEFPNIPLRTDMLDGDADKEKNFKVLRYTKMPAILTENFFMDNDLECNKYLMSRDGRDRIAHAHFMAMLHIEKHGI